MSAARGTLHGRPVRGLTLWRPWPWTFTHADKRVENRTWEPPAFLVGGWLALHAGKRFDREATEDMADGSFTVAGRAVPIEQSAHPDSVVVAVARLSGFYRKDSPLRQEGDEWCFGPVCWQLPEVHVLDAPVPCKGRQGLWKLPADVLAACEAQLADGADSRTLTAEVKGLSPRRWGQLLLRNISDR